MKTDTETKIKNLLGANPDGLTIGGMAEELKITRQTVSAYMKKMEKEEIIIIKPFYTAKVCKLKKSLEEAK